MIMRIPLLRTVCKAIVAKADWDESKHPRADNGQFGSGSGGSSKPKKPSKTRRKMERREEAASQARVGGAIQSLLSGGSALDKIGWFKQPEKPKVEEKPKPTNKIESAKQEIANNVASGKLKKETVIAAIKTMYERANEAERRGDDKTAKELDLRAQIMIDGADIKGELYSAGILQMRGKPLASIGSGMETHTGRPRNYINTLETAHRIENYRNKVISRGEVLDEFREGEQNLSLYQYNGKTYLVDHDHPDQFSTISRDSWRRLKDELTGDDEPHATPSHGPPTQPTPPTRSPLVTEVARSNILQHGKKIDEYGKASLHEYNGGLYMVTENKPMGIRISRPAWESTKYA